MKAFLYARVSTGEQDTGMQLREMVEACERRKWPQEIFTDSISGAREKRPGLDRMMDLVRRGKCDVVMVYRFDRFARSVQHLVNALTEFQALGVQFISLHEAIDTTTPMGKFAFTVFAGIAEFERELIRERVRSGVANARAKGVRLGRPRRIADVSKILALRRAGSRWKEVCRECGVSVSTAKRLALCAERREHAERGGAN